MANALVVRFVPRLWFRWNLPSTPWMIERAFALIVGFALLGFAISVTAVITMQNSAQQIGHSVDPVVAAEQLGLVLSDMDAEISAAGLDTTQRTARYRTEIDKVAEQIVEISRQAGSDEVMADSLHNILAQIWSYFSVANNSNTGAKATASPATATGQASEKLRHEIIPAARRAAASATANLETAVKAFGDRANAARLATILPIAATLAIVVLTQMFLKRRTRRFINVPLATASIHLAVLLLWFLNISVASRTDLLHAKDEYFDRLDTLYSIATTAHFLRADEEIWLSARRTGSGDSQLADAYQASFTEHARQVLDAGDPAAQALIGPALDDVEEAFKNGQFDKVDRINGLMGTALTLAAHDPDARAGIIAAARSFLEFLRRDTKIRGLAASGDYAGAVELLDDADDGTDVPLGAGIRAVETVIAADQDSFRAHVTATVRSASTLPLLLAAALSGTILLSGFGLWQRHREYQ